MEKNNKENIADWVHHPNHYQRGGIECFDVIKEFFGDNEFESFCLGNALKYVMRCKHKGKYLEDLKKARFYLDIIITNCEKRLEQCSSVNTTIS